MNEKQSSTTHAVNDSEGNNNYTADKQVAQRVQNGATASGQDAENVSETFSVNQSNEERLKKFDIELKTKMPLKQARFKGRKLELETQMKELETKYHQLEEERELELKVKRTPLENDDVRSQATSA